MEFERLMVGTSQLSVVAETAGPSNGWPVLLLHGFPYDPWSYAAVAEALAAADFDRAAASFDNPDFVDVVIHSYRHRYGLVPGDPVYDEIERELSAQPQITVPTIVLDPTEDPMVAPQSIEAHRERFTRLVDHRLVSSGHDMPHDNPDAVVRAVLDLRAVASAGS